jgi:hypothetical protein
MQRGDEMGIPFNPILLKYEGLDADAGMVGLGELGQSIQGASKLLGVAGNLVVTGQYAKKAPALAVRVMVAPPRQGSYELAAIVMSIAPLIAPVFPPIADLTQRAATKAIEGIVNYVIAKISGKPNEAEKALDVAETALKEMGRTSRAAIGAVERMAANQRAAVRLFVAPVGETCATAQIGNTDNGAIKVDTEARALIDASDAIEVGPESTFDVLISELDLKNRSCKVSLHADDDPDRRVPGEITDPVIREPHNPYSEALAAKRWIKVRGKAELIDGDIERLYISDVAGGASIEKNGQPSA